MDLKLEEREGKKKEWLVVYVEEEGFMEGLKEGRRLVKGKRF